MVDKARRAHEETGCVALSRVHDAKVALLETGLLEQRELGGDADAVLELVAGKPDACGEQTGLDLVCAGIPVGASNLVAGTQRVHGEIALEMAVSAEQYSLKSGRLTGTEMLRARAVATAESSSSWCGDSTRLEVVFEAVVRVFEAAVKVFAVVKVFEAVVEVVRVFAVVTVFEVFEAAVKVVRVFEAAVEVEGKKSAARWSAASDSDILRWLTACTKSTTVSASSLRSCTDTWSVLLLRSTCSHGSKPAAILCVVKPRCTLSTSRHPKMSSYSESTFIADMEYYISITVL